MKKLFCISDVHSFYDEMILALDEKGYDKDNSDHILVSCGDLLDRGSQANECLQFINNLPQDRKILIRGNHELLMDNILYKKGYFDSWDYSNGTVDTIEQLTKITESCDGDNNQYVRQVMIDDMKHNKQWTKYYNDTVMFAEIGKYIFVHGWIPIDYGDSDFYTFTPKSIYNPNWRDSSYRDWKDATWLNGMEQWSNGIVEPNKTIVCGHWHTSWGHTHLHGIGEEWGGGIDFGNNEDYSAHFEPFEDEGIIALDACTAYSGQVNCYIIEVEDSKWQLSM